MQHCGGGNMKKQLKRADASGAAVTLLLGAEEAAEQRVTIKYMRGDVPQTTVDLTELTSVLTQYFSN
jgi:histidyl-tRNA synthetase